MNKIENSKAGTVYPFLDARTPLKKSNMLPVKLSVNIKGEVFRIGLKLHATPEIFNKAISSKGSITNEAKKLKGEIDIYVNKAKEIFEQYPHTTQKMFVNLFKSGSALKVSGKTDLAVLFQSKIDELTEEDRPGSISFYEAALRTFRKFRNTLYLEDITVEWLKAYRAWYVNLGNSYATAQMHMRCVRHIYNRAIKDGYISQGMYPFKDYTIGTASKSKNVLYPEQLKMLWDYKPLNSWEARSKDFFILLYLLNGMNIKDALSLKGTHVRGDMISFVRAKTSKTNSETKEIMVYLHPEAKRIIEKYGSLNTNDYIFPYFRGTKTDIERQRAKILIAHAINNNLWPIGVAIGLPMRLTTNLARHSYATRLKMDGVPTAFISDALGHSTGAITAHYLKTLPDAQYKRIGETLLEFE